MPTVRYGDVVTGSDASDVQSFEKRLKKKQSQAAEPVAEPVLESESESNPKKKTK